MRRVLLVIAAAGLLASAATAAQTAVPDTKRMVLQLGDLSTGFERTSGRYISNTQAAKESPGKDYTGLGRVIGYESEFQRSGSGLTGILEITSSASLYKTSRGAHLSLLRSEASAQKARPAFRRLSLGAKLGDEAALYVTTLSRGGNKIDVYSIAWRSRNVFAAIIVGALANTADPAEVVALAAKQQRRITAATRKH